MDLGRISHGSVTPSVDYSWMDHDLPGLLFEGHTVFPRAPLNDIPKFQVKESYDFIRDPKGPSCIGSRVQTVLL